MPYWRLSAFYLFYFGTLGAMVPYWPLYLKHLGFSAQAIGELIAVITAVRIVSPNIWAWIADHRGRRMGIVRIGAALTVVCFAGAFWATQYWELALVMAAFSFFWTAVLPQFEAMTLTYLGEHHHRYATIRVWGSIGFIAVAVALGSLTQDYGPHLVPYAMLLLYTGIWLSTLAVAERGRVESHHTHEPFGRVLCRREVVALVAVAFLMQASHGPYYTFYTIYMEAGGYGRALIGQLWALGVAAEVGVFLVMARLVHALGLRVLLLVALGAATLRWLLIGYAADSLPLMLLAQVLHAATFGIFHATTIALFHHFFTGRNQGRGQAIYSSLAYGAGGAVGAWYSGITWDYLGPGATFAIAALLTAVAFGIAWRGLTKG